MRCMAPDCQARSGKRLSREIEQQPSRCADGAPARVQRAWTAFQPESPGRLGHAAHPLRVFGAVRRKGVERRGTKVCARAQLCGAACAFDAPRGAAKGRRYDSLRRAWTAYRRPRRHAGLPPAALGPAGGAPQPLPGPARPRSRPARRVPLCHGLGVSRARAQPPFRALAHLPSRAPGVPRRGLACSRYARQRHRAAASSA